MRATAGNGLPCGGRWSKSSGQVATMPIFDALRTGPPHTRTRELQRCLMQQLARTGKRHFQGLAQAAKAHGGQLSNRQCAKLRLIDDAAHLMDHITPESATAFFLEVVQCTTAVEEGEGDVKSDDCPQSFEGSVVEEVVSDSLAENDEVQPLVHEAADGEGTQKPAATGEEQGQQQEPEEELETSATCGIGKGKGSTGHQGEAKLYESAEVLAPLVAAAIGCKAAKQQFAEAAEALGDNPEAKSAGKQLISKYLEKYSECLMDGAIEVGDCKIEHTSGGARPPGDAIDAIMENARLKRLARFGAKSRDEQERAGELYPHFAAKRKTEMAKGDEL